MAESRTTRQISVTPFRALPNLSIALPTGLPASGVSTLTGAEQAAAASTFGTLARQIGGIADQLALAEDEKAGRLAGLAAGGPMVEPGAPAGLPPGGAPAAAPMGPLSAEDQDAIVRTVYGEARGEAPEGQAAVASVIVNRMRQRGGSARDIVTAKNQFEPWATRRAELEGLSTQSDAYQAILRNIQPALQGQDPTGGATLFYAPQAQAALGRAAPAWATGEGRRIGGHVFFREGKPLEGRSRTARRAGKITELQAGATRNLPIAPATRSWLEAAAAATGLDVEVTSGGQPARGERRTGSHRHDEGGAADIQLRDPGSGKLLDMRTAEDREKMAAFIEASVASGASGVGAALAYMGPNRLHIGGGTEAVWGEGGAGASAPDWVRGAFARGKMARSNRATAGLQAAGAVMRPSGAEPLSFRAAEQGFRPTGGWTLRSRAYDQAGTEVYLNQLETNLRTDMFEIFRQRKNDPAALAEGFDQLQAVYEQKHVFDEILPRFREVFSLQKIGYQQNADELHDQKLKGEWRASMLEDLTRLNTSFEQQLADPDFDPTIPGATNLLIGTQNAIAIQYDRAVEAGLIDPEDAASAKIEAGRSAAVRYYGKQAEKLSDPVDIAAYGEELARLFSAGELDGIDGEGYVALTTEIKRLQNGAESDGNTRNTSFAEKVESYLDRVAIGDGNGQPPSPAEWAALTTTANTVPASSDGSKPSGREMIADAQAMRQAGFQIRYLPPDEAEQKVRELQAKIAAGGTTEREKKVLDYAVKQLEAKQKLDREDPLLSMVVSGRAPTVPPLSLGAGTDPAQLTLEMQERTRWGNEAARVLRQAPKYFRPGEPEAMKTMIERGDIDAGTLAEAIVRGGFGGANELMLGEIGGVAPGFASAADVSTGGGDPAFLRQVAYQMRMEQTEGYKKPEIKSDDRTAAIANAYGNAFLALPPEEEVARTQNAERAFLWLARERGVSTDIGMDSAAANLYEESLQRAAGQKTEGGVVYGGIVPVNGRQTYVPMGEPAAMVEPMLQNVTQGVLDQLPPIAAPNGVPVTPEQLAGAQLFAIADGYYRVADRQGRFFQAEDGGFWILNYKRLKGLIPKPRVVPDQVQRARADRMGLAAEAAAAGAAAGEGTLPP